MQIHEYMCKGIQKCVHVYMGILVLTDMCVCVNVTSFATLLSLRHLLKVPGLPVSCCSLYWVLEVDVVS